MDINADVVQSKVSIDSLLGDCWRIERLIREKLTIIFFEVTPKISFNGLFFGALWEMLLMLV
jgi:hypothetical protein